jgi:hypothetical protein
MSLSYSAAAHFLSGDVHDNGRQLGTNASFFLIGRIVRSFIDRQELDAMRPCEFAHRSGTSELFAGEEREHAGWIGSPARDSKMPPVGLSVYGGRHSSHV